MTSNEESIIVLRTPQRLLNSTRIPSSRSSVTDGVSTTIQTPDSTTASFGATSHGSWTFTILHSGTSPSHPTSGFAQTDAVAQARVGMGNDPIALGDHPVSRDKHVGFPALVEQLCAFSTSGLNKRILPRHISFPETDQNSSTKESIEVDTHRS